MSHPKILNLEKTALAVIDFQESFRQHLDFAPIAANISRIVRGFQLLNLPVIITEQYPKGLGRTAGEILEVLPERFRCIEKSSFSSCGASQFLEKLQATNTKQVLVCGLETHVCVNQTVHDLLDEGYEVHLLQDAVGSRSQVNKEIAIAKMTLSGAVPSCVEMALFELMRDARHEKFKEIQNLIK